jgi:hypothetical protein
MCYSFMLVIADQINLCTTLDPEGVPLGKIKTSHNKIYFISSFVRHKEIHKEHLLRSASNKISSLLGFDAVYIGVYVPTFLKSVLPPS